MNSKNYIITKIKISNSRLEFLSKQKNEIETSINKLKSIIGHTKEKIGSIESRLGRSKRNKNEWPEVRYTAWIHMYQYRNSDYNDIETTEYKIDDSIVGYRKYESKNVYELERMLKEAQERLPIWENTLKALEEEPEDIEKEIKIEKRANIKFRTALFELDLPKEEQDQVKSENKINEKQSLDQSEDKNKDLSDENLPKSSEEKTNKRGDNKSSEQEGASSNEMKSSGNKGIMKKLRAIIKRDNLKDTLKLMDEIVPDVKKELSDTGFNVNDDYVHRLLNKEGINDKNKDKYGY